MKLGSLKHRIDVVRLSRLSMKMDLKASRLKSLIPYGQQLKIFMVRSISKLRESIRKKR